jgi:hypothetical protein
MRGVLPPLLHTSSLRGILSAGSVHLLLSAEIEAINQIRPYKNFLLKFQIKGK